MASTQTRGSGSKSATKSGTSGPTGVVKSHKSFQSVLPCGNKLLQRKWDQTYYDEHRRLVRSAKPMVDTKAPAVRPHITCKLKKKQLQKERSDEIDRDNHTLLKKMQRIMDTEGQVDHRNKYRHRSLNDRQRQEELDRIAKENRQMLKRLEQVQPMHRVSDCIDSWRRKEELTEMITAYPESTRTVSDRSERKMNRSTTSTAEQEQINVVEEESTNEESKDSVEETN